MNRRQLLLHGAAVAALAIPPANAAIEKSAAGSQAPRLAVVQDPAYVRSREYAALLVERGAQLFTSDDMLGLWRSELAAFRQHAGAALRLTGLTTWSDFIVLRDCAREVRLKPLSVLDQDAGRAATKRATLYAWVLG